MAKEGHTRADEGTHTNMFNTLQNPFFAMKAKPAQYEWAKTLPQFRTGGYSNTMLPITTTSMPQYWESLDTLRKTTYVQIITGEKPVEAFDDFVKGEKRFIGWDYAHAGDYVALPTGGGIFANGHRYTTEMIVSEIKEVIDDLVKEL